MNQLNNDCLLHIISFLQNDHHTLFQLCLTSKQLFILIVPILYNRPFSRFQKLSDKKKIMLEDLLWESQQQQQQQQQQQRQRQQPPLSIDYYSFVKEIVESPARRPADSLAGILGRTLTFREVFGAKIKRAKLSTAHHDLLEPSIKFLSHLEELFLDDFDESGRNQCSEWMYETVEVALKTHQSLFPGRLRKIVYKIEELYGHPRRSDPKMMLLIRKVMDGQWCTDELILDLPEEIDQDYLMVLKDEELPKLVRDLQIYHTGREVCEIHWVQPLEMFVSRCRKE